MKLKHIHQDLLIHGIKKLLIEFPYKSSIVVLKFIPNLLSRSTYLEIKIRALVGGGSTDGPPLFERKKGEMMIIFVDHTDPGLEKKSGPPSFKMPKRALGNGYSIIRSAHWHNQINSLLNLTNQTADLKFGFIFSID